jgi:protease YdgD
MWRVVTLLVLFAACAQAATPPQSTVLPGVGARDPRVGVDIHQAPWTAVVRVQIPGVSRCTGVLIAPTLVLTAGHCVWGQRLGHFMPAGSIHVLAGYGGGTAPWHAVAMSVHVADGFDPRNSGPTRGADAALLTLAAPIADASSALPLAPPEWSPSGTIMIGGYNQDRIEVIEVDPACHVLGLARDAGGRAMLVHDCTATRGVSGAPVLAQGADGRWMIAGLAVGAFEGRAGGVAVPSATLRGLLP